MDIAGARKFHFSSRSLTLIIPLITLLLASIFWNLRQHRLIEQKQMVAQREVATRANEEAERKAARMKKNAEWAASDARVQQLYREITNLSQINEQINERLVAEPKRSRSRKVDDVDDASDSP